MANQTDRDIRAEKILSVIKPILESIRNLSGRDIPWGGAGFPTLDEVDQLLRGGETDTARRLRAYYSLLSNLRNQASDRIKWGKGDIPELEFMDSTLAGLYSFLSEYVLRYEFQDSDESD